MYEQILVPVDGSEASDGAVEHAVALATEHGAALHFLHALEVGELPPSIDDDAIDDAFQQRGQRALDRAVERAEDAGVEDVTRAIVRGTPHRAILGYASDHDVDLVVMGTHGRTGFDRIVMGSVAEKVVRLADVPVMTIRAGGRGGGKGGEE